MKKLFLVLSLTFSTLLFSQPKKPQNLDALITYYNDHFLYEKSIILLDKKLEPDTISAFNRFELLLLKANTYKRLFNYEEVFENLKDAEKEGLKSNQVEKVKNIIRAERALAYFDIKNVAMGKQMMTETIKNNYKDLKTEQKVYIMIMEATKLMDDRNLISAEDKLKEAEEIALQYCPRELPLVMAKKMVLYSKLKQTQKQNESYHLGLYYAKKYKILKYEMYMYEVMKYICIENNDNESLKFYQRKFDSLFNAYNAIIYNGKITILEKKLLDRKHIKENQSKKQLTLSFLGLIVLLLIVSGALFVLYQKNRERRKIVEEENKRIHQEIALLAAETNEKGENKINLSHYNLTERQIEIIQLIKQGKTNKEIGQQLYISENTVKYHLKIIYDILDIAHRSELR